MTQSSRWYRRALIAIVLPACARHGVDPSSSSAASLASGGPPRERSLPGECSSDVPVVPPIVVGPGKIRVLLSGGLHDSGFRILDLTNTGSEVAVEGECPDRGQPEAMALLASGATGIVCRVGDAAYFGSMPPRGSKIDWLWRERLQLGGDGWHVLAVRQLAELEDRIALVFEVSGIKGSYPPASLAVQVAPGGERHFLCSTAVACPDTIVTLLVTGARLHVIGEKEFQYSDFSLGRSGEPVPTNPTRFSTVVARNRPSCVAQSQDGSVVMTLPLAFGRSPATPEPATANLRYTRTSLPLGPFVYPAGAASCDWTGFDAPELPPIPGAFDWARATLGERWLLVYRHASPCPGVPVKDKSGAAPVKSFWVYRESRASRD